MPNVELTCTGPYQDAYPITAQRAGVRLSVSLCNRSQ